LLNAETSKQFCPSLRKLCVLEHKMKDITAIEDSQNHVNKPKVLVFSAIKLMITFCINHIFVEMPA